MLFLAVFSTTATAQSQWGSHLGINHAAKNAFDAYMDLKAPHGSRLNWMLWPRLSSTGDDTENVVQYSQHYHTGKGSAFGHVIEVQKSRPEGNVWGIEVDLMTQGKHPESYYRVGVGVVLAPSGLSSVPESWASHAFMAIPFAGTKARVDYGLEIAVPCDKACVAVPDGERVQLSHNPVVGALRFDPDTGILGMWRRDRFLVWGVQQETGEVISMRQF